MHLGRKRNKNVGACETVLSLENINKVLFRQYSKDKTLFIGSNNP